MKKLVWDEKYRIGVERIDGQHRQLFEIVSRLIDIVDATQTSRPVTDVLDELIDYAQYHFSAEESLMLEYNYPGYDHHHKEHLAFFEQTANYYFEASVFDKSVANELLEFLSTWLTTHVLGTDLEMKPFFAGKIVE